jgi:hypothetical protein
VVKNAPAALFRLVKIDPRPAARFSNADGNASWRISTRFAFTPGTKKVKPVTLLRPCEALDDAGCHGIGAGGHDDGNCRGRTLGGESPRRAMGHEDVHPEPNQLARQVR